MVISGGGRPIRVVVLAALLGGLAWTGPVAALPMSFDVQGVADPNLTAHVEVTYTPGSGVVDLAITNTSTLGSAERDPRLTGFSFNLPANGVTGVVSFTGPGGWRSVYAPDAIDTPGLFGKFDVAGLTGPSFGGGKAGKGMPGGATFEFQFVLGGPGAASLDEGDLLELLSYDRPGRPNEAEQYFIVRFQRSGPDGTSSDVAIPTGPAVSVIPPPPVGPELPPSEGIENVHAPEPSTLVLVGSGLVAFGAAVRRRLRRA